MSFLFRRTPAPVIPPAPPTPEMRAATMAAEAAAKIEARKTETPMPSLDADEYEVVSVDSDSVLDAIADGVAPFSTAAAAAAATGKGTGAPATVPTREMVPHGHGKVKGVALFGESRPELLAALQDELLNALARRARAAATDGERMARLDAALDEAAEARSLRSPHASGPVDMFSAVAAAAAAAAIAKQLTQINTEDLGADEYETITPQMLNAAMDSYVPPTQNNTPVSSVSPDHLLSQVTEVYRIPPPPPRPPVMVFATHPAASLKRRRVGVQTTTTTTTTSTSTVTCTAASAVDTAATETATVETASSVELATKTDVAAVAEAVAANTLSCAVRDLEASMDARQTQTEGTVAWLRGVIETDRLYFARANGTTTQQIRAVVDSLQVHQETLDGLVAQQAAGATSPTAKALQHVVDHVLPMYEARMTDLEREVRDLQTDRSAQDAEVAALATLISSVNLRNSETHLAQGQLMSLQRRMEELGDALEVEVAVRERFMRMQR